MVYCTHFYVKRWKFCTPCFKKFCFFIENLYATGHYGVQSGSPENFKENVILFKIQGYTYESGCKINSNRIEFVKRSYILIK